MPVQNPFSLQLSDLTFDGNITEWAGVTLGDPSNYGTSPGAVEVIGVNAYVTNTVTVDIAASQTIAVTNAGTFAVQDATSEGYLATLAGTVSGGAVTVTGSISASNPSVGTTGVAAPGSATEIGIIDGSGNLQGVSASNPLPVTDSTAETSLGYIVTNTNVLTNLTINTPGLAVQVQDNSSNPLFIVGNPGYIQGEVEVTVAASQTIAVTNAGTFAVQAVGTLTHDNAAPSTKNIGVLPAIANASAPTYTEGDQVLVSTDLAGNTRIVIPSAQITTLTPPTAAAIAAAIVSNPPEIEVTVAASQTIAVTNAGTFAVQAAITAASGSIASGAIASGAIAAGAAAAGAFADGSIYVRSNAASTFPVTASIASAQTLATVTTVAAVTAITDALPAGTNTLGSVSLVPATSGGLTAWDIFGNTLTDSSQEVKSSPGQFYGYTFFNPNAVTVYLMIYSASETCGSATNRVLCMGIPAGAGANIQFSDGIACATTIYAAISTAVNSAAAPATQCVGTLYYY